MKSRLLLLLAIPALALATGCMSFQSYGSPTRGHTVSADSTRADVIANLGEPDSVYRSDDTEVFIYKGLTGANYLGIYSTLKREDTVVVMDNKGNVRTVVPVEYARGRTLISPPWLEPTSPIPVSEATESPENYQYVFGERGQ